MSRTSLYELLPALYRRRDREDLDQRSKDGSRVDGPAAPLEALFAIMQTQFDAIESELSDLYEDWFVETGTIDALRRLAEPFDVASVALLDRGTETRSLIANLVAYRRAKGTSRAFDGFASDATGWTVRLQDGIRTQAVSARLDDSATLREGYADLRRTRLTHAPRSFDVKNARHGIQTAIIEVWRAGAVHVEDAEPYVDPLDARRRTFNPAGADVALMHVTTGTDGSRSAVPFSREAARVVLANDAAGAGFRVRDHFGDVPMTIEDLSEWTTFDPTGFPTGRQVFVDPELGRILLAYERPLRVDYAPVAPDGIGSVPPSKPWGPFVGTTLVVRQRLHRDSDTYGSLRAALQAAAKIDGGDVRIVIADSSTMREAFDLVFAPSQGPRSLTIETAIGVRPALFGTLVLRPRTPCAVALRGLLIRGRVVVGGAASMDVESCTFHSDGSTAPALLGESANRSSIISVRGSMIDAIEMSDSRPLHIEDSIIIGATHSAAALFAKRVTFIASVRVHELTADDCVFNDAVISRTAHTGYLRFCLLSPIGTATPVRFSCIETTQQMLESRKVGRLRFARLNPDLPEAARNGGSEGWEIGAFAHYAENTRIANLRRAVAEYVPVGVSTRIEFRS